MLNIRQLHDLIEDVAPIYGVSHDGNTYRIDFMPDATEQQRADATAIAANFVPEPDPRWDEFLAAFNTPGNPLYASVAGKVAQSGFLAQDHWSNFKLLLTTLGLRSPATLSASITYLGQLLDTAGHPLSSDDISDWNGLMDSYDFPESCKL